VSYWDGTELSKHAEVVADRPPLSDLAGDEPVHGANHSGSALTALGYLVFG
jgi:hypothetical protein